MKKLKSKTNKNLFITMSNVYFSHGLVLSYRAFFADGRYALILSLHKLTFMRHSIISFNKNRRAVDDAFGIIFLFLLFFFIFFKILKGKKPLKFFFLVFSGFNYPFPSKLSFKTFLIQKKRCLIVDDLRPLHSNG